MVDIFTLEQFQNALSDICDDYEWEWKHLGVIQGNHAFDVDFGSSDVLIRVFSSVAPGGRSREDGEDSIRAWVVSRDGKPVGGKTQKWVTRKPGWQKRLSSMLYSVALLGRWIQPCPRCKNLLGMSVKGDKVYIFCGEDAKHRNDRNHVRHIKLVCLDKETGEPV